MPAYEEVLVMLSDPEMVYCSFFFIAFLVGYVFRVFFEIILFVRDYLEKKVSSSPFKG